VLAPTLASRLQGDYRTGKRILMKKVIGFIASGFKRDRIWARRSRPSKREYQVAVCIDDSASMLYDERQGGRSVMNRASQMALEALVQIGRAMTQLEVGELAVLRFGERAQVVHPFGRPFTDETGAECVSRFTFRQGRSDVCNLMETVVPFLGGARDARAAGSAAALGVEFHQIVFILSDGRDIGDDRPGIRRWVREARDRGVFVVFVILDNVVPGHEQNAFENLRTVSFVNGKVRTAYAIDRFPFENYILLSRDLTRLPEVLATALRQWFESVAAG
jgi:midasin